MHVTEIEMSVADWISQVNKNLTENIPVHSYYKEYQSLLISINQLMEICPISVQTEYAELEENQLQRFSVIWQRRFTLGPLPMIDLSLDDIQAALQVGGLVRALDIMVDQQRSAFGPVDTVEDWKIGGWYLVPRKLFQYRQPSRGQPFSRRGLLHHRLVPASVRGMKVNLIQFSGPRSSVQARKSRLGAAFFNDVKLHIEHVEPVHGRGKEFLVTSVTFSDELTVIDEHFEHVRADNPFAVVWPELTVPERIRDRIKLGLADQFGNGPEVSVAGSWHEKGADQSFNISHVFNRFGQDLIQYRKFVPYSDKEIGRESIFKGDELFVIVTDEFLVSLGICKDFCAIHGKVHTYSELNVDLILVPSMSGDSGMRSHQAVAKSLRHAFGAQAFVVQQMDHVNGEGVHAMVLDPGIDPGKPPILLKNREIWISVRGQGD